MGTAFTDPCHEELMVFAFRNYVVDLSWDFPLPEGETWEKLAVELERDFDLDTLTDTQGALLLAVIVGVRAPDTEGYALLDLNSTRLLHSASEHQAAHSLRAADHDGAEGDRQAVAATRAVILDLVRQAYESAARDEGPYIDAEIYLDFYGQIEVEVAAPWYYLGRAAHAVQDSYAHTIRSDDLRRIRAVLNYVDAITEGYDEERDGLRHSDALDGCRGENAPLVNAAREATVAFLLAVSRDFEENDGSSDPAFPEVERFLDDWLSYDDEAAPCTVNNDYCQSYWAELAREELSGPYLGCQSVGAPPRSAPAVLLLLVGVALLLLRLGRQVVPPIVSLLCISTLGCDGDEGSVETELLCEVATFEACGGEVAGTWSYTSACSTSVGPLGVLQLCPEAVALPESGRAGTLDFFEDGHVVMSYRERHRFQIIVPGECLGRVLGCDDEEIDTCPALEAMLNSPCVPWSEEAELHFSCSEHDGGCQCGATTFLQDTSNLQATYRTEGTTLLIETGEGTEVIDYCVQGRLMDLSVVDTPVTGGSSQRRTFRLLRWQHPSEMDD